MLELAIMHLNRCFAGMETSAKLAVVWKKESHLIAKCDFVDISAIQCFSRRYRSEIIVVKIPGYLLQICDETTVILCQFVQARSVEYFVARLSTGVLCC